MRGNEESMSTPISHSDALPVEVDASVAVRDTADGLVFEVLSGLYGRDLTAIGLTPRRHHQVVSGLAASRAIGQPAAAVYLAVKQLLSDEQPALLSRLDERQEALFDVFADVLDEVLGAAQLQRLVALHTARLAFSSRYLVRLLHDAGSEEDLAPREDEQPDARLRRMLGGIADATTSLEEVLGRRHAAVTARVGLPAWDLQDEHAWREHQASTPEAVARVEGELVAVLRPWLVHIADLECLVKEERMVAETRLRAWGTATAPLPRS